MEVNMRDGWKTTEFWIIAVATILTTMQEIIWPEHPFPKEQLIAIGIWIAGRTTEKIKVGENGKRAWNTSEFWVTMLVTIATYLFPQVPLETIYMALGWVGIRTYRKSFSGNVSNKKTQPLDVTE